MTERKQRENSSVRQERRPLRLTKAHKPKTGEGEGKGALSIISCIQKGKRTLMQTGNTRLLT